MPSGATLKPNCSTAAAKSSWLSNSRWNVEECTQRVKPPSTSARPRHVRSDNRAMIWAEAAQEGLEADWGMKVQIKPGLSPSGEELDWTQRGREKEVVV